MMPVPEDVGDITPENIDETPVPLPEWSKTRTMSPSDTSTCMTRMNTTNTFTRDTP